MEIIVGVTQDAQSRDALALGSALAASLDLHLVVANIFPVAYNYPSPGNVYAEWYAFLIEQIDWARQLMADRADAEDGLYGHKRKASTLRFPSLKVTMS